MIPGYGPVAQLTRQSGTSADGTYVGELKIPQGSEAGDWFISMGLNDQSGNHGKLEYSALEARGFPSKIHNGP
jgi:hypothetical protein